MKAIDRVMSAYSRTHILTEDQQQQVRGELSRFIQELLVGKQTRIDTPNEAIRDDWKGPIGTA